MDLNARPTRNFWDIFHCCRNIGEGENDENPTKFSATNNYAFTPMKFLDTKGTDMMNPSAADSVNTPTTVATADFSFDSQDSKLETITEDDNIFDDDLSEVAMEETEQQSSESEKEADFNEQDASFIYDKMTNLAEQQDDDDMPDMDSLLNDTGDTKTTKDEKATQQCNQAGEVTFYHFFIFMILRHIFGPLLGGVSIKKKKMSYWEKFLSFTNCSSSIKDDDEQPSKESVRTMKLRQLKLDEGKCEVYPSLSDVPPILEDEILL